MTTAKHGAPRVGRLATSGAGQNAMPHASPDARWSALRARAEAIERLSRSMIGGEAAESDELCATLEAIATLAAVIDAEAEGLSEGLAASVWETGA